MPGACSPVRKPGIDTAGETGCHTDDLSFVQESLTSFSVLNYRIAATNFDTCACSNTCVRC